MRLGRVCMGAALAAGLLLAGLVTPTAAQTGVYTGRIDVAAVDTSGAVLPGVTVATTGPQNQTLDTDSKGEAHFLNLPPGTYQVKASLSGFREYQNQNVSVVAGGSVPLKITLSVGGLQEQVDVSAESPIVDTRKQAIATNVTLAEMQDIPNSRDPWVVLQTVPGIVVDRVNVGGADSGQQSNFIGKGANRSEATWNLEGVPVTDMAATGAAATYWDFDAFQEIGVTTGGADVQSATPGVQLNFAMKTGTDTPHGNARIYFENEGMQSNNLSSELAERIGGKTKKGNRTDQFADYGGDIGGPIIRGRWWGWGAYGKTDVRVRTLTDVLDRTILDNRTFKTNATLTDKFRTSFMFFRGDKLKFGRGAAANRPDETTFNQTGPTTIYKPEFSFAGQNLFVVARGAVADMGFSLTPRGGLDASPYLDDGGVWHNSYWFYGTDRPQRTVGVDGNYFKGRHELKFGYGWRKFPVDSIFRWAGANRIYTIHDSYPNMLAWVTRDSRDITEGRYQHLYFSDTLTFDRATLTAGLRWDGQTSSLTSAQVEANAAIPSLLPALTGPAQEDAFEWNMLAPRVGLVYSLDESRKTQARASYAMFASQLGAANAAFVNAVGSAGVYYAAVDLNDNRTAEPNELLTNLGLLSFYGFDPANPTRAQSPHRIGDVDTPRTQELIFGFDREIMPNLGASASFTYRYLDRFRWNALIGVSRNDFFEATRVTGTTPETGAFDVPVFGLPLAKHPPGNGREAQTRPGYHQRYLGLELSVVKRMSNRWMARFGFSTSDHNEYFDDPARAIQDPTPSASTNSVSPLVDGGEVIQATTGSGKTNIFLVLPKYQFIANGVFQGPWGVNFGANLVTRQGFGQPFWRGGVRAGDRLGFRSVLLVQDPTKNRLPNVTSLDVRIEKAFRIQRANVIFDLDIFNVTNSATVLVKNYDARFTGPTGFGSIREIMNPRVARLGLRFNF